MTLNIQTRQTARKTSILLAIFASFLYFPAPGRAMGNAAILPGFSDFSKSVQNGDAKALRGVYVEEVLALPIVQQPADSPGYVSTQEEEVTQFDMPSQYGNVGLLAHSHLSGKSFTDLEVGQQVQLVYGDGRVESFVITEVLRFQALQPTSPYSSFRNLDKTDETLTAEQMFKRVYLGDRHVTFQTCIEAYGNNSWGRLFVIAEPKSDQFRLDWMNMKLLQ